MKRKILLLIIGVSLIAVVVASAKSSVKRKAKFDEAIRSMNVLNNDLITKMSEKPTLESIRAAHSLLDQRSGSVKEKIIELRLDGRLRKNSEDRIQMDEFVSKNTDKIIAYYEKVADSAQGDLEYLNDLKDQFINAGSSDAGAEKLRKDILQHSESLKVKADTIKEIENLMEGLKKIYQEVETEDENV